MGGGGGECGEWGEGGGGAGNSVWREKEVEKENAVLDAEESGGELGFDWIFDWICVDLGRVCGAGWGVEWVVGMDRGEGVESGWRVL